MKIMFKRFLPFLLGFVLMMSSISVTAYAEDNASAPDDEINITMEDTLSDSGNNDPSDFETLDENDADPSDSALLDEEDADPSAEQAPEDDRNGETQEETDSDDQGSAISDASSENEDTGAAEDSVIIEDENAVESPSEAKST